MSGISGWGGFQIQEFSNPTGIRPTNPAVQRLAGQNIENRLFLKLMFQTLTRIFGSHIEREIRKLNPLVDKIESLEPSLQKLSQAALKAKTAEFQERLHRGAGLNSLLPEAFAVCREASKRILGLRHYRVQLVGGVVLHRGQIAEMKTGEGKTLAATLPVYLNGLTGRGVHIVTVNDYLAQRDRRWMGELYHFLGLSTGAVVHNLSDSERRKAYAAHVTYGTNNEFGFDYLRDNMKLKSASCVQRELNYAIIDECDSILIDEARTPLIISGSRDQSMDTYYEVKKIIPHLKKEEHFTMEEKSRSISLTEAGGALVEKLLKIENLYDIKHIEKLHNISQSLKAHHLYKKDVDYMVREDEVVIVDEFTGRLMPGRRWSEGLHQAVEVKEGVRVKTESRTLSTITFQNYFRMYQKLAGMTGTAETEAKEFKQIYKLDVKVIPTNAPVRRTDYDDVIYKTEEVKFRKIIHDVLKRRERGQPCLVGTVSIEKSERLSQLLTKARVPHKVLNAKRHAEEAEIVAQAGRFGAVTIATNMAGRGTDIILGGNPDFLMKLEKGDLEEERRIRFQKICQKEKEQVIQAGGLFIVGTERHESRRVDNQLRGRSGRQGDPGGSRFYLSLEDDLMRIFGGERMKKLMGALRMDPEDPITDRILTRAIANAQKKVEGHNFEIRKHLLDYDDVMNRQRKAIFDMRRGIMKGKALERTFRDHLSDVISDLLERFAPAGGKKEDWNLKAIQSFLKQAFLLNISFPPLPEVTEDEVTKRVKDAVSDAFERKKLGLGEHFEPLLQYVLLHTIDIRWREHLENIEHLRDGINLRAYGQKDPLIEYKKESFAMFEKLHIAAAFEVTEKIFKIEIAEDTGFSFSEEEEEDYQESRPALSPLKMKERSAGRSFSPSVNRPQNRSLNRKERRLREKKQKQKIKI